MQIIPRRRWTAIKIAYLHVFIAWWGNSIHRSKSLPFTRSQDLKSDMSRKPRHVCHVPKNVGSWNNIWQLPKSALNSHHPSSISQPRSDAFASSERTLAPERVRNPALRFCSKKVNDSQWPHSVFGYQYVEMANFESTRVSMNVPCIEIAKSVVVRNHLDTLWIATFQTKTRTKARYWS